jgi:hypothetical protein
MKIDGGCYCGNIRYTFEGDVAGALQCHCRECQYITGGNPNVIVILPEDGFKYTSGEPASFSRPDLDNPVTRYFCSDCGTAIGTTSPNAPGSMIIKVGTIDDPSFFKPGLAIFTKDAQSFHHIPDDLPSFEGVPG